jgi:hypothetical protein
VTLNGLNGGRLAMWRAVFDPEQLKKDVASKQMRA